LADTLVTGVLPRSNSPRSIGHCAVLQYVRGSMAFHAWFGMAHASGMHAMISQSLVFCDIFRDVLVFWHRDLCATICLTIARIFGVLGFHQCYPFSIALATLLLIGLGLVDPFLGFVGLGSVGLGASWFGVAICSAQGIPGYLRGSNSRFWCCSLQRWHKGVP